MGGSFDPVHAAHAIERVAVTVMLSDHIDGSDWPEIYQNLRVCAKTLDMSKYVDGFQLFPAAITNVERQYPTFGMTIANSARFIKAAEDGLEEASVTANRSGIQIESQRYIRWSGYEEVVCEVLSRVVASYPKYCVVSHIRLEYEDRFIENNTQAPRSSWNEVLAEGDLITASHLAREGAWHMHSGWFESYAEVGNVLINLNINAISEIGDIPDSRRSVGIQCQTTINDARIGPHDTGALMNSLNWLHLRSKEAVRSVLTSDMRRRISIDVEE